ncbi:MAG TPA: response regulator [Bacillus bacterium]|nr:response regulator [Bacillus sp. (in: firmicutes)]
MVATILVADDAAFMRTMLKSILVKGGYEVIGKAENGLTAIAKYKELKPDLVTLDITMPEMDGITALKEIRKINSKAKIIMCSAMGQHTLIIKAIEAGAKDFIVKPFQESQVLEAVKDVLG